MRVIIKVQMFAFFTDSNSPLDDTDAEFRSRVEKIRQMGGDSWLKIFDEIQGEEEMLQVWAPLINTRIDPNPLFNGDFFQGLLKSYSVLLLCHFRSNRMAKSAQ